MRNVLIGVPTRGQLDAGIFGALSTLAAFFGCDLIYERGHLSAGMTRNRIVQNFLDRDDVDTLLFVDDDVAPSKDIPEMIAELDNGWDVVASAVPIFKPEVWPLPVIAAFRRNGDGYALARPTLAPTVIECDAVGTGCFAIKREVLEALPRPFSEEMSEEGMIISDDVVFCRKVKEAGFRLGCDFRARSDHITRVSLGAILNGIGGA
jgi:GT2 family glycosyltransferase